MHSRHPRKFLIALNVISLTLLSACNKSRPDQRSDNNTDLPTPITVAQTIPANSGDSVCDRGGIRLVYGLDHNRDGKVGPYESLGAEYLCHDQANPNGPRVVVIGNGIPEEDKERILRSLNRS